MKFFKAILIALTIGGIVFLSVSCAGNSSTTTPAKPTIATVQRGNMSISVTGTGNLALEYEQELSFGQTGLVSAASNVKISDVLVQAGDVVKQGQVLVKADTSDLQDTLTQDQHNLDTAQANLLQAQDTLATDQMKLSQQSAVAAIQTEIDNANTQLQTAQAMLQQAMVSQSPYASQEAEYWSTAIKQYQANVSTYQTDMTNLLANPEYYMAQQVNGSASSVNEIKSLQMQIQQDQQNITLKQNAVEDAQTQLNNDQTMPQEIDAPFNGLITQVNVTQGDIVQRNANLIEIAQPDKFVANILVNEIDVMSLKIGEDATVTFDALPGLTFPAKITQIAPVATVQQGVVNYAVTVELTSTQPIFPSRTGATGQRPQQFTGGGTAPSSSTPRATTSSGTSAPSSSTPRATTSSGTSAPSGTHTFSGTGSRAFSGGTANQLQSINLKDGLSATVNIVVQQVDNVLMVPSRAITYKGQTAMVEKVVGTGTEQTIVHTGITDGTNTEIISGLNEGDQVSIPALTTSATTSTNSGRPPGGGFIFRGGG